MRRILPSLITAAGVLAAPGTCQAGAREDYDAGVAALSRGDQQAAAGYFEKALTDGNAPHALAAQAYFSLGAIQHGRGDFKAAKAEYDKAIALNPNFAAAYGNRGNVDFYLGDKTAALADFNRAVELAPSDPGALGNRGYFYLTEKTFDKALDDFSRAIAINPNIPEPYCNRGIVYFSLGDEGKAMAFRWATRARPWRTSTRPSRSTPNSPWLTRTGGSLA